MSETGLLLSLAQLHSVASLAVIARPDEPDPLRSSVCISACDGWATVSAVDRFRLARIRFKTLGDSAPFVVPTRLILSFLRAARNAPADLRAVHEAWLSVRGSEDGRTVNVSTDDGRLLFSAPEPATAWPVVDRLIPDADVARAQPADPLFLRADWLAEATRLRLPSDPPTHQLVADALWQVSYTVFGLPEQAAATCLTRADSDGATIDYTMMPSARPNWFEAVNDAAVVR